MLQAGTFVLDLVLLWYVCIFRSCCICDILRCLYIGRASPLPLYCMHFTLGPDRMRQPGSCHVGGCSGKFVCSVRGGGDVWIDKSLGDKDMCTDSPSCRTRQRLDSLSRARVFPPTAKQMTLNAVRDKSKVKPYFRRWYSIAQLSVSGLNTAASVVRGKGM